MHRAVMLSGSSHPQFATQIAGHAGFELINVLHGKFANGEIQFELLESVRGADVYIVQTNCPPVNDMLMELLIMVQTCRYAAANRIIAVLPFFPYARQDKMDTWQPISAKLVANMLVAAGVNHVITMDIHAVQLQGFFDIPCDNLNSHSPMVLWIRNNVVNWRDAVIVAADKGAVNMASALRDQLDLQMAVMYKQRSQPNEVESMILVGEVHNKPVVIIDDMSDTSGTLCFAAEQLFNAGASQIYAFVTHGIFSGNAVDKIMNSHFERVVCTNTLPMQENVLTNESKFAVVDVAFIFAKYIKNLHDQYNTRKTVRLTVTELFDRRDEYIEQPAHQRLTKRDSLK